MHHMGCQAGQDNSTPQRHDPNFVAENIFPLIIIFHLVMVKKFNLLSSRRSLKGVSHPQDRAVKPAGEINLCQILPQVIPGPLGPVTRPGVNTFIEPITK